MVSIETSVFRKQSKTQSNSIVRQPYNPLYVTHTLSDRLSPSRPSHLFQPRIESKLWFWSDAMLTQIATWTTISCRWGLDGPQPWNSYLPDYAKKQFPFSLDSSRLQRTTLDRAVHGSHRLLRRPLNPTSAWTRPVWNYWPVRHSNVTLDFVSVGCVVGAFLAKSSYMFIFSCTKLLTSFLLTEVPPLRCTMRSRRIPPPLVIKSTPHLCEWARRSGCGQSKTTVTCYSFASDCLPLTTETFNHRNAQNRDFSGENEIINLMRSETLSQITWMHSKLSNTLIWFLRP